MRTRYRGPWTPVCADPGHRFARPYAMRGCSKFKPPQGPTPAPHLPPGPPAHPVGTRESDETTLPLLNRAILWSFVHLKAHSVHAPATSIRIVCENMMQSQASQLDKCKSMHVGQSKRVIDRAFMWRGALDAFGNHRFKDPAPAPSSSASRAAAKCKSAHVRKFTSSHQVQY